MQSIRRRLKKLSKTFPPPKDTGPDRLQAAVLAHLSVEDLYLLRATVFTCTDWSRADRV